MDVSSDGWSLVESVGGRIAGASPLFLTAALTLHAVKLAVHARAWQNILRASTPGRRVRYADAAAPYFAGVAASCLVPFGAARILRVAVARFRLRAADDPKRDTPTAAIVGSLAVERVLDVGVTVVVAAIAVLTTAQSHIHLRDHIPPLGIVTAQPVVASAAGAGVAIAVTALAVRFHRRLSSLAHEFARGFAILRRPTKYVTSVASWQLLSWVLRGAALVLFLAAFHVPHPVAVAPVVLSMQLLAGSLPLTPGGAGTQQALLAATLGGGIVGFSAGAQVLTTLVDLVAGLTVLAACGLRARRDGFHRVLPST
jgi:uncharacterized membrane protein YbhN (UPF0104 family)